MSELSRCRDRSGASVIELIVALLLLALTLLGLTASMVAVSWQMKASWLASRVGTAAQAEMERLLAAGSARERSGAHREVDGVVEWTVGGPGGNEVRVVGWGRLGGLELADTLNTLVGWR